MSKAEIFHLSSGEIEMDVTNFGCRVMKLMVPDSNGVMADVVAGYNTVEEYLDTFVRWLPEHERDCLTMWSDLLEVSTDSKVD